MSTVAPALLIALQSSTAVPQWFPPACDQPTTPGKTLVEIHDNARQSKAAESTLIRIEGDGHIWVQPSDLEKWSGQKPIQAGREWEGMQWYPLANSELPYRFDPCTQTLWIAPLRETQILNFRTYDGLRPRPVQRSGFLNLDALVTDSNIGEPEYAALADLGLASEFNSFRSAWVSDGSRTSRLDSQFVHDDPVRLHRFLLGDAVTRTDLLGTAVRYGGFRWGTDFAIEPEVPRFTVPSLQGQAALPSTVELYVDGVLRGRSEADPGTFNVMNPPVYSGNGNLQVVVRDALGRETLFVQPFYISTQLLAEDTQDYAVELGQLRESFGLAGDRYGDWFAQGFYRRGVTSRLTVGTRVETQRTARTAGVSAIYAQPAVGELSAGMAVSGSDAGQGSQLLLGYQRIGRSMNVALRGSWSDPAYVELGRTPGAIARTLQAQVGFALPNQASLSLAWQDQIRRDRDNLSLTALNYSQRLFGTWYGTLSLLHSPRFGDTSLLSLSRAVGNGHSLSVQLGREPDGQTTARLTWQYSPPQLLGWRYQGSASRSAQDTYDAIASYTSERGTARFSATEQTGFRSGGIDASTALAWVDSDIYWTRKVNNSFIVADASAPDVRIYRDNQLVATTGDNGRALVPDVIAYIPTQISLNPQDLPLDRNLTETGQQIKIPTGGAVISLAEPARKILQILLSLPDGTPVPAGADARINGLPAEFPVGFNGLVYLEAAGTELTIKAQWKDMSCTTEVIKPEPARQEVKCLPPP